MKKRADRAAAGLTAVAVHALGAVAFFYPFLLDRLPGDATAHASDAPALFTVFGTLLVGLAVADVRAGRMDARRLALLGVLSGVNALLRVPGAFGGASAMFALPILCGFAFGARFGFLLGASSMAASAGITAGIGPWLPFQMWALGWIGAGAGLLRRRAPAASARAVVLLAAYGWVAGLAFGALVNLWFWPFLSGSSEVSWVPGIGATEAARRYWRFYVLTSLGWDSMRAAGNAVLIAVMGRPVLALLVKFRKRLEVQWEPAGIPAGGTIGA